MQIVCQKSERLRVWSLTNLSNKFVSELVLSSGLLQEWCLGLHVEYSSVIRFYKFGFD